MGGQQTSEVLPAAVRLWERAGITAADLDAVAVSAGPGSYTGLRVGFSLAKGMALARGLPVVAIPTLEAVAYQHRDGRGPPLRCGRRREGAALRRPFRARGGGWGRGGRSGARRAGGPGGCPGSGARWPCSPRTSWPGAWRPSGAPARLWRALPPPDRLPAGRGCPERALRLPRRGPAPPCIPGGAGPPAPRRRRGGRPGAPAAPLPAPAHLTGAPDRPACCPSPTCRQGRTMCVVSRGPTRALPP